MQYIVLFSHLTVQLPSVVLSQKHELAVCKPAPFFCMITHVTKNFVLNQNKITIKKLNLDRERKTARV